MTIALPIAWTGVVLGGVGFIYALIRDVMDGKRIDDLESGLDDALSALDKAVVRISYLEDGVEEREAPQSASPQVNLEEPATQPILRVPTDTVPQDAAIDRGLAALTAEVAHYGRHAHRMPRGVK